MRYFNNLPIININDSSFRNLFKRVIVNQVREDQLRSYRVHEYETLPSIANKVYGSPEFWWVIALINNIQDINFDISMPTEQIEYIATELATQKRFLNSLMQSSIIQITSSIYEYEVVFPNTENSDYVVILLPMADGTKLADIDEVEYGYEKINPVTFKIHIQDNVSTNFYMAYAVFKIPDMTEAVNTADFVDYFDKLLREADAKRTIRLIREQDLSYFITQFLIELNNEIGTEGDKTYKEAINYLRTYPNVDDPSHGLIVDFNTGVLSGDGKFTTITIDNFDYDYHIYLSTRPTVAQLGTIGDIGIRSNLTSPRVYNTGIAGIDFDYLVVSPDDKRFSGSGEIIQSGIERFAGAGLYKEITLDNSDQLLSENDIGVMITPIIDRLTDFEAVGKYSFTAIDKNTIRIYNTGDDGNRFYWSVFKNMLSPFYNIFPGFGSSLLLPVGYSTDDVDKIGAYISPAIFVSYETAGDIGAVSFVPDSITRFNLFNSGNSSDAFNFNVIIEGEYGDILTDSVNAVTINVENHVDIVEAADICIVLMIKTLNNIVAASAGDLSVELIDKNQVKVHNTGASNVPVRYNIIHDALQHGIETTDGNNDYVTITLDSHEELIDKSQICLFITPIYKAEYDMSNVGEFSYLPVSLTEVRVYNTGLSGIDFKWILTKKQ